jgi:hypothetical protein
MKKQVLAFVMAAVVACSTSVSAFSADVLTNFNGFGDVTGRFYTDIPFTNIKDMKLITGFQSSIYTSGGANTTRALLGVQFNAPVVGNVDLFGTFSFARMDLQERTDSWGTDASVLKTITLAKNWTTRIADNLVAGVTIPLLTINTNGTKQISILSNIQPQIGMRLDI